MREPVQGSTGIGGVCQKIFRIGSEPYRLKGMLLVGVDQYDTISIGDQKTGTVHFLQGIELVAQVDDGIGLRFPDKIDRADIVIGNQIGFFVKPVFFFLGDHIDHQMTAEGIHQSEKCRNEDQQRKKKFGPN